MASNFQPEHPHSERRSTGSWGSLLVTALVAALAMLMILAIGAPRWFENAAANWGVSIGVSVLTFIAVLAIGWFLRSRGRTREDASSAG